MKVVSHGIFKSLSDGVTYLKEAWNSAQQPSRYKVTVFQRILGVAISVFVFSVVSILACLFGKHILIALAYVGDVLVACLIDFLDIMLSYPLVVVFTVCVMMLINRLR